MPWINTSAITPDGQVLEGNVLRPLTDSENLQVYCGLDCCVTAEVRRELQPQLASRPNAQTIYSFERALQAPYLDIMLRGFLVDDLSRRQAAATLHDRITTLQRALNSFSLALHDQTCNARSHKQLTELFYRALRLPEIWTSHKGERKLSLNRDTLEKLYDRYLYARPFVSCILSIRDLAKQCEVLESDIDADGRFRASYNIAGTETGRTSSSSNAFGTGGNAQNIAPGLRHVFVSDPGWKLCVIDLEQVEARDVGFFCGCLFNDWIYLDACESGDLHTSNARRIWPELPWTGEYSSDRALASGVFYRDFTYRDMAKRGAHLSNYMGTAFTAARALKVPLSIMEDFQSRYCRGPNCAFPCISRYWQWIAEQIQTTHLLITPFGRERHFFGRPNDDATLREAIAYLPQSTTSDRCKLILFRVWRDFPEVQLLAENFDSITFQFPNSIDEVEIVSAVLKKFDLPLFSPSGRRYVVPGEAKTGWNWGNYVSQEMIDKAIAEGKNPPRLNPEGLKKWNPHQPDIRTRKTGLERAMAK